MKHLLKRIIVIEMEISQSEANPTHYQTTQRVLNEYTPEKYKELFAKLQVVERTYADMKQLIGDFKECE
ncbi:hypothetical protein QKV40_gp05 [Varidnaviria sp.]|uniref:Uncharacterized protein n=1 Tax=Lokiarchaeia virus SkuldV1 TaxID=3058189 RepID=A0AA46MAX1_9VIRU|nr:hypothetical protein QKV40_gp05 [Varidnaviria sp.]UPO70959.1 hypothetical protein 11324_00005 [Lokiarchaeia virus SkuldV1]